MNSQNRQLIDASGYPLVVNKAPLFFSFSERSHTDPVGFRNERPQTLSSLHDIRREVRSIGPSREILERDDRFTIRWLP